MKIPFPPGAVSVMVLGIMQDGGLPHAGCLCSRCQAAFENPALADSAACIAIIDGRPGSASVWMIDATPDIKHQLQMLAPALGPHPNRPNRLRQPDAVFLTHAHMGHIAGLPQLGNEAMAVENLPVFASAGLGDLLKQSSLCRPLLGRLDIRYLEDYHPLHLASELSITPIPVPHRDEWQAGTFAYKIQGPNKSLLYLPDIDAWELWPEAEKLLSAVDFALVDASFYDTSELGGRPPVAHPFVPHTLRLWSDLPCQLLLTHINHTNPILDASSEAHQIVVEAGAQIARTGQILRL